MNCIFGHCVVIIITLKPVYSIIHTIGLVLRDHELYIIIILRPVYI